MNANEQGGGVVRQFVAAMNPCSGVKAWEISPCLEFPDHEGGGCTEAFETVAEAERQSDEAIGPIFWGVYANLREEAVAAGNSPAIHIKDFESYDDAIAFVRLVNGSAGEGCKASRPTPA